jgi:transposase-like protein
VATALQAEPAGSGRDVPDRGFIFSYEAVREWEAKLTPALVENLRRERKGRVGRSWYVDER